MLGKAMPDILIRVFNSIGTILYFISATVTITAWICKVENGVIDLELSLNLLLIQAILSYINCTLYGIDMVLSLRKSLAA